MNLPSFEEFYQAVHKHRPFPWQIRLADEVLNVGWKNLLLDLPTGSGKTSVLDVAVYALACAPDRMPRRTVLVVDRRVVVDQAAVHAKRIQEALSASKASAATEVARVLKKLTCRVDDGPCLEVAVMRGGMPRDNDWARSPDQPMLGLSTVDQLGSRLLFRGYGVSPRSAPIHAGLLGNDTLILLDEVHLSIAFAQTLDAIRSFRPGSSLLPDRFEVVQMSATVSATEGKRRFTLQPEELEGEEEPRRILRAVLDAQKPTRLHYLKVSGHESERRQKIAETMVAEALGLQRAGASVVGLVVNRVDTARIAYQLLEEKHKEATEALLVTGRMRPLDRDRVTRSLLSRAKNGRVRSSPDQPLIVVATQCIEAGADLDFDGMVSECAALDALKQRFGRVDRSGHLKASNSVLVGRSDFVTANAEDPIYGSALAATWSWLNSIAEEGRVDFGIRGLPDLAQDELQGLISRQVPAPVLLPAHLDGWCQTSAIPSPDADPSLWLHGPERGAADVQLVWRELSREGEQGPELYRSREIYRMLEAVRPSVLEAVSVPVAAARAWLADEDNLEISDTEVAGIEPDLPGNSARVAYRWTGEKEDTSASRGGRASGWVAPGDIRPGDVLVVDIRRGGLRHYSFDPNSKEPVLDLGDLAHFRARGSVRLRLLPECLRVWGLENTWRAELAAPAPDETQREFRVRVSEWIRTQFEAGAESKPLWEELRPIFEDGKPELIRVRKDVWIVSIASPRKQKEHRYELLSESVTESDEGSFLSKMVYLSQHCYTVQQLAQQFAGKLFTQNTHLVEDLALAGRLHDVGKADPRFQRWLMGGDEVRATGLARPIAKSEFPPGNFAQVEAARLRAGYPKGYRHELLSVAMLENNRDALRQAHDPELVLHLVASHHGWCRPFAPPVDDAGDEQVLLEHDGVHLSASTRHRLSRPASGVADRFWTLVERYGWWGLAWLEAIVRLADHNASDQERKESR